MPPSIQRWESSSSPSQTKKRTQRPHRIGRLKGHSVEAEKQLEERSIQPKAKYVEIPHVLDGFLMLNAARADDPDAVWRLDISNRDLRFVIEDDLTMFTNLNVLICGENTLPFAKLGVLPALRTLTMPCNQVTDMDLEVDERFTNLETLDLSYNVVSESSLIVLASLPKLKYLDVSNNNLRTFPIELADMSDWRSRVAEMARLREQRKAEMVSKEKALHDAQDTQDVPSVQNAQANDVIPSEQMHDAEDASLKEATNIPSEVHLSDQNNPGEPGEVRALNKEVPSGVQTKILEEVIEVTVDEGEGSEADSDEIDSPSSPPDDSQPTENPPEDFVAHPNTQAEEVESTLPINAPEQGDLENVVDAVEVSAVPNVSDGGDMSKEQADTPKSRQSSLTQSIDEPVTAGPGFQHLEVLVLADNRFNTAEAWSVLGQLPSLRVLNVSRNRIKSLSFLSRSSPNANVHNNEVHPDRPVYSGFPALKELHLVNNLISTPEDLIGVVWLGKLRDLYLDGNPIMKERRPHIEVKADEGDVLGYIEFQPLVHLPALYGITVADAVYQKQPYQSEELTPHNRREGVSASGDGPKFLSHLNRKNAPPSVRPGHHIVKHVIDEPEQRNHDSLDARSVRRMYRYTDDDIAAIIRSGRIPDVEEIGSILGKADEDGDMDIAPTPMDGSDSKFLEEPEDATGLQFLPGAQDDTFITGVHITGSLNVINRPVASDGGYESGDENDDIECPLPNNIRASIRALRHALSNPVSYWRVLEETYATPTAASERRKHLNTGDNVSRQQFAAGDQLEIPARIEERVRSSGYSPGRGSGIARAKDSGRWVPKDEFEGMRDMMTKVDDKLTMIETSLSAVLTNPRLSRYIPKSRRLLDEIQQQYERIEAQYTAEYHNGKIVENDAE
ncbi:hypothetical protein HDU85_006255 [Gaertneriomyces sp. JEL0708]|nr:hypothetical protein HDU85_006255 [Gaertneriomyces sp. JEL0708]